MFRRTRICTAATLAIAGGLTGGALPVFAQTQQAAPQRIEITGSNIRRVDAEQAAPVQVISRQEIERSGKATVGEYLQTLSVDNAGSVPSSFGTGFATGATGVSLRGLGAGSTLVLLNGRRIAPYGLADDGQKVFTDLSVIPMEAVERVEILKDGASAVYGSDAIAGVVNIILRKDFKGVAAKATYGTSRYSDGAQKKAALTGGFGDLDGDGYNIFFNLEALKADEIRYADRDRDWIGNDDTRRWGYAQGGSFFTPGGAITGTGGTAAGSSLVGNVRVGTGYVSLPGCGTLSPAVTPADPQGGCLWLPNKTYRWLLPDQESYNFFTRGTVKLGSDLEGYAELGYSKKRSVFQNTPSGVSGSWGYPGGARNASSGSGAVVLAPSHPDNVVGGDRLRYSAWDVGPRVSHTSNDFYRVVAGVKGSLAGWDFDTALLHSETKLTNQRDGFLRYSVAKAALGDPTSVYFPWRIGINAHLNDPSLYAALSPTIEAKATSKADIVDAKGSRELVQLPGGPLMMALGLEVRRESSELTPVTYTDIGDIIGLGYSAYQGSRTISATYAELVAPVVKGLELSGAVRYDHYSNGLNSTTPKVGIKWTPSRMIALRGTYAEGFRAPNPAENGKGGLAAFTTARDPVRCPGGTPAPGASASDCNAQIAIITTPNPNLSPEKSKSYTLGLVFEPMAGTNVAIDYWEVKRRDEINQITASQAIGGAGTVVRSDNNLPGIPNSGTLLAVSAPYINSASSQVRGIDLDAKQRFQLGDLGQVTAGLVWTHLTRWRRIEKDGTTFDFAGTHDNCDVTNCIGTPKDRVNFSLVWDQGPYQVSTQVNYIGALKNHAFEDYENCASHFADGSDAPAGCKIPSFTTVDVSGRWAATKQLEVFGSIQNLFDKVAPLDPTTYGAVNFNPLHVSGAIGRYYTVGLKYKF
jgi:iron complex outermembrane receptor protein